MNDNSHGFIIGCICAAAAAVAIAWALAWWAISDTRAKIAAGWIEVPAVHQEAHWERR